jgi:hypothetical protein
MPVKTRKPPRNECRLVVTFALRYSDLRPPQDATDILRKQMSEISPQQWEALALAVSEATGAEMLTYVVDVAK